MSEPKPVIYLFHGNDEFKISQEISQFQQQMGDPSSASMNINRFEGVNLLMDELEMIVLSVPFLTPRRLVLINRPTLGLKIKEIRERFFTILEKVPDSTALVLIENESLTRDARGKKLKKVHWLIKWAKAHGDKTYISECSVPKGGAFTRWIIEQASASGGQFTSQAALFLSHLVGDNTRLASQEIEKLLLYVNYSRPVEVEDVQNLVDYLTPKGDYFGMIDAIVQRNGRKANESLHLLLQEQDAIELFWGLITHFRRLLLARDITDRGKREVDIAKELGVHPFYAEKLAAQARRFDIVALEDIHRQFLKYDIQMKTSQITPELTLETFIAVMINS